MPLSLFSPSSSPRPRPHQTQTLKSLAQLYQVTNLSLPKSTIRSRCILQHQFRFAAAAFFSISLPTSRGAPQGSLHHSHEIFPGMESSVLSPKSHLSSSSDCSTLARSGSPSFPYFHDWKFDYETKINPKFDAPKYSDFTNPENDLEEEEEAELWFGTAPTYPPSPHVIRWKLRIEENSSSFVQESENMNPNMTTAVTVDDKSKGCQGYEITQDVTNEKPKSALQRCASFMNPTVSHLAKQNDYPNVQCDRLLRRLKKLTIKDEKQISRSSSFNGSVLTKRQKLEAGYVGKVARLKHQASFPHKSSKKVGQLDDANALLGKPKTTIT